MVIKTQFQRVNPGSRFKCHLLCLQHIVHFVKAIKMFALIEWSSNEAAALKSHIGWLIFFEKNRDGIWFYEGCKCSAIWRRLWSGDRSEWMEALNSQLEPFQGWGCYRNKIKSWVSVPFLRPSTRRKSMPRITGVWLEIKLESSLVLPLT